MDRTDSRDDTLHGALRIALAYAFFAGLWILLSDRAMGVVFRDPETLVQASLVKGWFFVAVTTLLLHVLVRRLLARLIAAHERERTRDRERQQTPTMLAAVAANTGDAIYVKDLDGRYLLFNNAAARFLGKRAEDVLGQDDHALFAAEQAEGFMAHDRRIIARGEVETSEEVIDTPAGRKTFLASKGPLRNADGRIFGVSRDITASKQSEAALRESEQRFIATFEQAAVGIAQVSPDGRWLRMNRKLCNIVGYAPDELMTKTFQDITHPDDLDADLDFVRRTLNKEIDSYTLEKRYIRKDGGIAWITLTVSLVCKADGTPDYFIAVVQDIGARKAAELALRDTEERLREAKALAGLGYWQWDLRDDRHTWSEEVYALYGRDPSLAPAVYPEVQQYFTPQSWAMLVGAVENAIATGAAYECDAEVVRPDGTRRWITARGRLIRDAEGKALILHGTVQDVTARKRAETELRSRNLELEHFNRAAIGRELNLIALKREINVLASELGRSAPYDLSFVDAAGAREAS